MGCGMKIYIDSECHCYTSNPENDHREFEVHFFDGKCQTFVEGHIYVPEGEQWTRPSDEKVFNGEMICAWKDYSELDSAQREYELDQLADYKAACERMGIVV